MYTTSSHEDRGEPTPTESRLADHPHHSVTSGQETQRQQPKEVGLQATNVQAGTRKLDRSLGGRHHASHQVVLMRIHLQLQCAYIHTYEIGLFSTFSPASPVR